MDRDVIFTWVKAHAGDYWNEMADQLAVEAGYLQSARSGDQIPKDIASP